MANRGNNVHGRSLHVDPCAVTVGVVWLLHVTSNGDKKSLMNDIRVIDESHGWSNPNSLNVKLTRLLKRLGGTERNRILRAPVAEQRRFFNSSFCKEIKSVPQNKNGLRRVVREAAHGRNASTGFGANAAVRAISSSTCRCF